MPEKPLTLVAVDDDPRTLELISTALEQPGLEILATTDPEQGLDLIRRKHPPIVLLDVVMPGLTGFELLARVLAADPGTEVILMTGQASPEAAVEAIQQGAADYLTKPPSIHKLRRRVELLLEQAAKRRHALELDGELLEAFRFEGLVGRSPLMLELFSRARRVAPHFRTALVTGATGTGKELVARALHRLGPAASGPFAVCNCSAIVETLFESELFGHVKGAFTGAAQDKLGLFEYAQGGTVFLDEIGDMPLVTQAKLLRVLQTWEIQRVGSPQTRKVDVRVVAATHRHLRSMVAEGQFREDLLHRLGMVELKVPRLAERREDLPLLQRHFLERFAAQYHKPLRGLTRRAQALLARYPWPGNVRELENALGHACMMAENSLIDIEHLPEHLRSPEAARLGEAGLLPLEEVERRHALEVLERVGNNKLRAAEILGVSRATLYRLLAEAGRPA